MRVDVVRLRSRGRKIERDALRAVLPVRGELSLDIGTDIHTGAKYTYASVVNGFTDVMPPLRNIRKFKIRGTTLLLVGVEEAAIDERGKQLVDCPQAWWCRLVPELPVVPIPLDAAGTLADPRYDRDV